MSELRDARYDKTAIHWQLESERLAHEKTKLDANLALKTEKLAHEQTRKELEENKLAYRVLSEENDSLITDLSNELKELKEKIKFLLERETSLEVLLNEANMDRLKPFVLRTEMDNRVGLLEEMNSKLTKELEELQDAITHYIHGTYVCSSDIKIAIENAIQASKERQNG